MEVRVDRRAHDTGGAGGAGRTPRVGVMPPPGTSEGGPLQVGGGRPRPEPGYAGVPRRRRVVGRVGSGEEFGATITAPVMKGQNGGNSERQL